MNNYENISIDELMFLHEVLNGGQVFAGILRCEQRFDFTQPKIEIFDGSDVSALFVSLLQFHRLLGRLVSQEFPLVSD